MAAGPFGGDSFTSVKTWITEATPANWPEGACSDILNMEIGPTGEVLRRLGIVEEQAGGDLLHSAQTPVTEYAITAHLWRDAGGSPGNDILLVQHGMVVAAYGNSYPLADYLVGSVTLETDVTDPKASSYPISVTSINGDAVIVHPKTKPQVLSLNEDGTLSLTSVKLEMRVQESISYAPVSSRPTALTPEYEFDLRNAGWPYAAVASIDEKGTGIIYTDPVSYTKDKIGAYPALSDLFYAAKTSSAEEANAIGVYSPWELRKTPPTSGFSVNGRFITEVFSLDTGVLMSASYLPVPQDPELEALLDAIAALFPDGGFDKLGQAGTPLTTGTVLRSTERRPTAVATLNGRIVYAGRDYNDAYCLFFSQLAVSKLVYGKCYQEADPTAEEINDLVATDGGVIRAPGMGTVLKMVELNSQLIIFSTTGVWALDGGGGGEAFSATSFRISKISPEGCLSTSSVVEIGGSIMFFGKTGIHVVAVDNLGTTSVQNISISTIQTFYDTLPMSAKVLAAGAADSTLGRVEWTMTLNDDVEYYTLILVFDARLGGWRKHRVPYAEERIIIPLPPYTTTSAGAGAVLEDPLTTTTLEAITTVSLEPVVYTTTQFVADANAERRFRYLIGTHLTLNLRVGEMRSTTFKDWYGVAVAPRDAAGYIDFPYIYNSVNGATKRSARASAQYINAFTLRGRLL